MIPRRTPWAALHRYWTDRRDRRIAQQVHKGHPDALNALREALAAGGSPDQPLAPGDTPLLADAMFSDSPHVRSTTMDVHRSLPLIVGALLAAGADSNRTQDHEHSASPLISAARVHSLSSVQALLNAGADVHGRVRATGNTALHDAQHPEIVSALLNAGADPCARNKAGETPLHLAYEPQAVRLLVRAMLAAGGDPDASDNEGNTPAQQFARRLTVERWPAMVQALEETDLRRTLDGMGRRRL